MDRQKVINELNDCLENQHIAFMDGVGDIYAVSEETIRNVIAMLKEQESIIESLKSDLHETLEVVSGRLNVVRCKDCKHRPTKPDYFENGLDLEFPDDKCPCECEDGWYSWYPSDDWFCAGGERI